MEDEMEDRSPDLAIQVQYFVDKRVSNEMANGQKFGIERFLSTLRTKASIQRLIAGRTLRLELCRGLAHGYREIRAQLTVAPDIEANRLFVRPRPFFPNEL